MFTAEEKKKIDNFLKKCNSLLATGECTVAINAKNNDFDEKYPITHREKIRILRSLTADDCIKVEPNNNPRYADNEVYVFLKNTELIIVGEEENIELYIKMYLFESDRYDKVIVISFHEANKFDF